MAIVALALAGVVGAGAFDSGSGSAAPAPAPKAERQKGDPLDEAYQVPRRGQGPRAVRAVPPGAGGQEGAPEPKTDLPDRVQKENKSLRRDLENLRALEAADRKVRRLLSVGPAGPIRRGSGDLIFPVNGPIVSPFGQRWGRLHAGIDIASPAGTPIRAAQTGQVVIAGPVGGYGNYVCVQHTRELSTCYAHQSRLMTRRGAAVRQGQVIGLVGCTGHCFGDHLHFETRVGGRPVDPSGYL
ncbi:MAG: M23 family metallopeptidase [Actinomycetota bacterium]|nr:M23 family metallopeptidase [Actinomycetota bacterium]